MPLQNAVCQTCLNQRIKCDERKPICHRCAKLNLSCVQSKPAKQANFSFHLENCFASGKTKRPRGPRSSLTILRPEFDLSTQALTYYLQCHTRAPTDIPTAPHALPECIYVWKVAGRTCPMVDIALSSLALIIFSRVQHHPPAAKDASVKYQQLLRIAQNQIFRLGTSSLDEHQIDACLLAVYLMGRYEAANCDLSANLDWNNSPSFRHHDGALSILRYLSNASMHLRATFIIKQTRRGLIRSSILRCVPLPSWILDGSRFGEHGLELDFDRIYVQIVDLHCTSSSFRRHGCLQPERADNLNDKAKELDEALQQWISQLPNIISPQQVKIEDPEILLDGHFYTQSVYSYQTTVHASVWAHYLAARMLVQSTRLRILNCTRTDVERGFVVEEQRVECVDQLAMIANDLASTIPFSLERFQDHSHRSSVGPSIVINKNRKPKPHRASLIAWPLSIASSIEVIDAKQQKWFRAELAGLGIVLGGGIFRLAETQWRKF